MQEGNKREKRRETMSDVVTFRWRWRWRWWWWWNVSRERESERKAGTSKRHPDITQSLRICRGQISLSQTCKNLGSASTWQKMKYRWERGLFSLQLSPPPSHPTSPPSHSTPHTFHFLCQFLPPASEAACGWKGMMRGWSEIVTGFGVLPGGHCTKYQVLIRACARQTTQILS